MAHANRDALASTEPLQPPLRINRDRDASIVIAEDRAATIPRRSTARSIGEGSPDVRFGANESIRGSYERNDKKCK